MVMMWNGTGGWGMYGGGWIAVLLIFTLLAGAVAALVVATGHGHASGSAPPSRPDAPDAEADRILQRRFAAGEIDEDEYQRRRALLHDRL
jgi:putative membrane protein